MPARLMTLVRRFSAIVGYAALAAALLPIMPFPEVANGTILISLAVALILGVVLRHTGMSWRRPATVLPLAACLLIVLASCFTATHPFHVLVAFFFATFCVSGPVAAAWLRLDRWPITPGLVGVMAFVGTLAGIAIALYDLYVLKMPRAGYAVSNPIHLADVALTVGFIALAGTFSPRPIVRILSISTPILALITVYLTGSRGPLLAVPVMAAIALALAFVWNGRRVRIAVGVIAAIGLVAALIIVVTFGEQLIERGGQLFGLYQVDVGAKDSTSTRIIMYQSAFNAFLASPIVGYGLVGFVAKAVAFPPMSSGPIRFDHLHNDLADFAVSSGVMGLIAYTLLVAAPIAQAFSASREAPYRRVAILLGLTIPAGYVAMGATNAMFGVMSQSLLYTVTLALVTYFALVSRR